MEKFRVLVYGIVQSNYINQLYQSIIPFLSDYEFHFEGKQNHFKDNESFANVSTHHSNIINETPSIIQIFKAFIKVLSKKYIYKELLLLLIDNKLKFHRIKEVIYDYNIKAYIEAQKINDFNIVHCHFITAHYTRPIKYIKKNICIISTTWGSDLFRYSGIVEYYYQSKAFERSQFITVPTSEMKEVLLSKFGRALQSKIKMAKFIHEAAIYQFTDKYRKDLSILNSTRKKYNISADQKVIMVGHNAFRANNHLEIIDSFKKIEREKRLKIFVLIPFTYGKDIQNFEREIKTLLNILEIQHYFLKEKLEWDELAQLRLISNIMIHMPVSDGLSAALTEYLYTGGISIVGDWLPYNTLRSAGINMFELGSYDEVGTFINNNWNKLNELQTQCIF